MPYRAIHILFAVLIVAFASAAQCQIIANGSFEAPAIPPNSTQQTAPTSWTWSGTPSLLFNGDVNPAVFPTPQAGQQYVDIGNNPSMGIFQSFVVSSSGPHVLTWYDSCGFDLGVPQQSSPYRVALLDSSLASVVSADLDAIHPRVWVFHELSANLTPGTYTLRFTPLGPPNGLDTLIDNVSLVPEPASIAGIALLPLLLRRRPSRRNQ